MVKQIPPKVSVIIPSYNYGRYLPAAVQSVLKQTYPNIEIIIIDDGSTDATRAVAERITSLHSNVKYHFRQNGGLSAARNTGLRLSVGSYILFLDSDDKIKPSFVEECLEVINNNPDVFFVYVQMEYFGKETKRSHHPQYNIDRLKEDNYINASAFFNKKVFHHVRYDERMRHGWEDWDVYLSLAARGQRGILLDRPLLLYRKHEGDSLSMTDKMIQANTMAKTRIYIYFKHVRFIGLKRLLRASHSYIRYELGVNKKRLLKGNT